jgi:hypothetical protein
MALAIGIALWTTVAGAVATYLYDGTATLGARLCAGIVVGMALLGFGGYATCALAGRMTGATLTVAVIASGLPFLLLAQASLRLRAGADFRAALRLRLPFRRRKFTYLIIGALTVGVLCSVLRGAMYMDHGAVYTNNDNNLGDLPFHVSLIEGFLKSANFPPQDSEFAGGRLTYPFLVDFVAAQYQQAGASLPGAFLLQNVLLAFSLLALFYRWALLLTRSLFVALAAPLLVLFSGGLGFVHYFRDLPPGTTAMGALTHLPHQYTLFARDGLVWGNATTTLLTTQRGLMMAIPLALLVWTLWWQSPQTRGGGRSWSRMAAAGVLAGLLPLIHGHTFLMIGLVGLVMAAVDLARVLPSGLRALGRAVGPWALFGAIALGLALPQVWLLAQSSSVQTAHFFGYEPGWVSGDLGFFRFYWRNLGLFPILFVVALLWPRRRRFARVLSRRAVAFLAPFLVCFVVPNLIRLAPWDMDNMKVLLYWHIAASVAVAATLAALWRHRFGKIPAVALLAALTLSGALDVLRIAQPTERQMIYDADGLAFARAVDAAIPPHALILHYPRYDHPITATGRRLLMGYEGHLWSHGIDFAARKRDVQRMYSGASDARALLALYGVDYVVIGPPEAVDSLQTGIHPNATFFAQFPVAVSAGPYTLYQVR